MSTTLAFILGLSLGALGTVIALAVAQVMHMGDE